MYDVMVVLKISQHYLSKKTTMNHFALKYKLILRANQATYKQNLRYKQKNDKLRSKFQQKREDKIAINTNK